MLRARGMDAGGPKKKLVAAQTCLEFFEAPA